ncbi:Uncharacterised protein [Citrobacter koseri]|uniref:Uncharacterized protein n=1 Tax=Citrobacter koseri TaxID=545 RepID=A0A078LRJ2_CITKO|nr:hypothetical protein AN2351V1_0069 [Citrobacter koseri]CAH5932611.1 hypothetical protein AN2351V1_0069 [Citrobacter koseri]CDZ86478.1 hypothetical protein BN1086_04726 [Citrobacter koseri]SUX57150.1 Uncharacterised protein [Citrobacter koseri]SUX91140.1 Uncharacterised protein [Citrobacter koseri]
MDFVKIYMKPIMVRRKADEKSEWGDVETLRK